MKFTEWKEVSDKYYRGEERKECTHLYSELLPMINELNHKLGWLVLNRVQVRNLYSKETKIHVDTDWKQYEEDKDRGTLNIAYMMCTSKGVPTGVIIKSNQEKEKFMFVGMSEIQSWRISERNNYIESVKWSKLCKKLITRYDTNLIPTYTELLDNQLRYDCKALEKIKGSDKNIYDLANGTRFDNREEGKAILEHLLHPKTYPMTETYRAKLQQKLDDVKFANEFEQRQKDNALKLATQSFWVIGKDNLSPDIHFVTKGKFDTHKDTPNTLHNFIIEEDTQGYLDLNEHKDSDTIIPRLTLWSMVREEYIKTRGMSVDESIASYTLRDRSAMYSEKASIIACSTNNKLANQEWVLLFNDKE
jgi:hypothetical protein